MPEETEYNNFLCKSISFFAKTCDIKCVVFLENRLFNWNILTILNERLCIVIYYKIDYIL